LNTEIKAIPKVIDKALYVAEFGHQPEEADEEESQQSISSAR